MKRSPKHARLAWMLVVLAAWTLFAFAGAYLWTIVPLCAGALVLTAIVRPPIGQPGHRVLDLALVACLTIIAFQLVPLPPAVRLTMSPRVGVVDQALWVGAPLDPRTAPPRPLSIDLAATRVAFALAVTFVLLFWSTRAMMARGGIRTLARGVGWTGLTLSILALAQHATAPGLLYWYFPTIFGAAFGPYRNRNDFATWLIMAIPMTVGYMATRIQSRYRKRDEAFEIRHVMDVTAVWLGGSVCLMSAALLTSLSRSGLMGAGAGAVSFLWLSRRRMSRRARLRLLATGLVVLAIGLTYVQTGGLTGRLDETLTAGLGGRQAIWRETWRMGQDFWLTGVGAGAYERGMLVYQQTRNGFQFNHAHNEYLQLAVEGGWLLSIPIAIVLVFGIRLIGRRLRADHSPIFWIRVGAASSVAAIAVQSIWDTGLRMPANAVLFALLSAVALHEVDEAAAIPKVEPRDTEPGPRRRRRSGRTRQGGEMADGGGRGEA